MVMVTAESVANRAEMAARRADKADMGDLAETLRDAATAVREVTDYFKQRGEVV